MIFYLSLNSILSKMPQELKLCKDLLSHFLNGSEDTSKVIEIVEGLDVAGELAIHHGEDSMEIAMSKKTYLSLFIEAHNCWNHEILGELKNDPKVAFSTDHFMKTFSALFGLMLTTNGYHTMLNFHESLVWKRYAEEKDKKFLMIDFDVVTSLLSSRLKRINKSSSLWFLCKKLTVFLIYDPLLKDEDATKIFHQLVNRVFSSSEHHFANYYAMDFLKWCIRMNYVFLGMETNPKIRTMILRMNEYVLELLMNHCHMHITDTSLWTTLEVYCLCQNNSDTSLKWSIEEYNHISNILSRQGVQVSEINYNSASSFVEVKHSTLCLDEILWLLNVKCSYTSTYLSMLRPLAASKSSQLSEAYMLIAQALETASPKIKVTTGNDSQSLQDIMSHSECIQCLLDNKLHY